MADKEKLIFTTAEVCDKLNIHPATLRRWRMDCIVSFERVGHKLFFTREEAERLGLLRGRGDHDGKI